MKSLTWFHNYQEELKREVNKLPEDLLEEVYASLKRVIQQKKTFRHLTIRNFNAKPDNPNIRKAEYE